jgi:hypothetical protein
MKKSGPSQNPSPSENVRDTHYISPESNLGRSKLGGFNKFKIAGQTALG